ncbi:MAG: phospholipid carrier-dependent glycosyltransferase [Anaerolineales bacterium]
MASLKKHPFLARILDGIFLAGLSIYVFLGLSRVPFHGDESTLIRLSNDFAYLFQDRDIQKVIFRKEPYSWSEEQYQRVLTGAVDPLTIGLAWTAAGMDRADLNGFWRWYPSVFDEWEFNVRMGNMPSAALLNVSRIPSTLFTALSLIVVFAIAHSLARSRPAAWLAAFLYATTPAILVNGRRAMQEGAMLAFTALVVYGGLRMAREIRAAAPSRGRLATGYCLLGIFSGCALASKHTSALVIAAVFLALMILIVRSAGGELLPDQTRISRIRLLFGLLGSGLLGLSVFYILMPVWWAFPLHWLLLLGLSAFCFLIMIAGSGRWGWILRAAPAAALIGLTLFSPESWTAVYIPIRIIVEARAELTRVHNTLGLDLPTFGSRIGEMADQLLSARTQYYESLVWDTLEEEQSQIRTYEAARLDGRGGGPVWGVAILALAVCGSAALLFHRRGWGGFFLFLWLAIPAATLLLINTLAWQRYYLILIAPWSVLAGCAAVPVFSTEFRKRIQTVFTKQS